MHGLNSFFDWASTSPIRPEAWTAQRSCADRCAQAVDQPSWHRAEIAELDGLRASIRRLLRAPADCEVILSRSVSELMAMLSFGLRRNDRYRVIVAETSHPAAVMSWVRQTDIRTMVVRSADGRVDLDTLASLTTKEVLAIVVSHVTHLSGDIQPIDEIAEIAARAGAIVIVDGAQSVGRIPVALASWEGIIYLGSGRKSLMAPMGTAFMVGPSSILEDTEPLVMSPRSSTLSWTGDGAEHHITHRAGAARLEGNLPDLSALAALRVAVELSTKEDGRVLEHVNTTASAMIEALQEQVPSCTIEDGGTGIARIRLPSASSGHLVQQLLRSDGFIVAASDAHVRVSLHLSNTADDALDLARALARLLRS